MVHHLILLSDHTDLHVQAGRLISGSRQIAVGTLGSVQSFSAQTRWNQSALEWQCLACGLETSVGIIHKLRRNRPSLACDLIEPLRCCVELTVVRHLDEMHEKKAMAGRTNASR